MDECYIDSLENSPIHNPMMKPKTSRISTFILATLFAAASASAATALFDYGATSAQSGFTQISVTTGVGTSNGISISNDGDGLEFRDRTTQMNNNANCAHPQCNLLSDMAFENDVTTITFTLTGLAPLAEYTVLGYAYDADFSNDSVVNDWTTNGGTVSHGWEHEDITTASFAMANLTADAGGVATITASQNSGPIIIWNGFEITQIPEPSTALLGGLGLLALLRRRR